MFNCRGMRDGKQMSLVERVGEWNRNLDRSRELLHMCHRCPRESTQVVGATFILGSIRGCKPRMGVAVNSIDIGSSRNVRPVR